MKKILKRISKEKTFPINIDVSFMNLEKFKILHKMICHFDMKYDFKYVKENSEFLVILDKGYIDSNVDFAKLISFYSKDQAKREKTEHPQSIAAPMPAIEQDDYHDNVLLFKR